MSISDEVIGLICEQMGLGTDIVVPLATVRDDIGADSLDCIELMMCFEQVFHVEISDDDAERWNTVADVIAFIERAVAAKKGSAA